MNIMSFFTGGNYSLRKWANTSIVADGNSNVINSGAGTDGGSPFTVYLMEHLAEHLNIDTVTMQNIGVGGQTTVAMLADFESQVVPLVDESKRNLLLMWELGNDIYINGNVESAYGRALQYCQQAKEAGYVTIIGTCPHRYYSGNTTAGDSLSAYNTKLDEINALIRVNSSEFGGIADIASDWRFLDPGNTIYYRPDGVHFTEAGRRAIADIFSNAMIKYRL